MQNGWNICNSSQARDWLPYNYLLEIGKKKNNQTENYKKIIHQIKENASDS